MDDLNKEEIKRQAIQAVTELCEKAKLSKGSLFVVGCSTSEVMGASIGTHYSIPTAEALYEGIHTFLSQRGIALAAQCCEHLNRALVVERSTMQKYDLEQVNAIPQPDHAGGAFASVTYRQMSDPVLVESLKAKADAGIDIGGTLIGMHVHPVVVPVRLSLDHIGKAIIICARRRPKYVGGQRAVYDENLI